MSNRGIRRTEYRTSFLCGNHNGHHNTEVRTQRHIIGQSAGHQYTQINKTHNRTECWTPIYTNKQDT